jgi:uncharacterized membrane protein
LIAAISVVALAACGTDVDPQCRTSTVTYASFGQGFVLDWCRGCHSAEASMRQDAPTTVDLDTLDEIRAQSWPIIRTTAGSGASMPPAGGPSDADREMFIAWMSCGAP